MEIITANIQWIMLASGVLTLTMLQPVFAPRSAIKAFFGEEISGPAAALVVRNWGFLIVVSAAFLIYAAFHADLRVPALIVSGAGKLCFVGLVFANGGRYAKNQVFIAAIIDAVWILLFALYLVAELGAA
ncbi:MAG: hypothetical protein JNJ73_13730 [Hyphomonadaceae bacterium]|nr:hypothetical protein [Hyphomonadaceae bacterium]